MEKDKEEGEIKKISRGGGSICGKVTKGTARGEVGTSH